MTLLKSWKPQKKNNKMHISKTSTCNNCKLYQPETVNAGACKYLGTVESDDYCEDHEYVIPKNKKA